MAEFAEKERLTLTDHLRLRFKGIFDPVARFFNRLGIFPNTMTIIGLIGNAIGAYLISQGNLTIGGIVILAMGPVDALDGSMARLRGEPSDYGAFVDSVTDRLSEIAVYGGLMVYFLGGENFLGIALTYAAASGSIITSYIRARAQSVGYETKVGILTRFERYVVLVPALIFVQPLIGVAILAIGTNFTVLQRLYHVRKQALKN